MPKIYSEDRESYIELPEDIRGILGFRQWNYIPSSDKLMSLFQSSYTWKSAIDTVPEDFNGSSGLYAYQVSSYSDVGASGEGRTVAGLVEARGRIYTHGDGVLRAQWMRILCLFKVVNNTKEIGNVKKDKTLRKVLASYGVPFYVTTPDRFVSLYRQVQAWDKTRVVKSVEPTYAFDVEAWFARLDSMLATVPEGYKPAIIASQKELDTIRSYAMRHLECAAFDGSDIPKYKGILMFRTSLHKGKTPFLV